MPHWTRQPRNAQGQFSAAAQGLNQFTQNLRFANREAGAGWRLQQQENRERQGLITSLAKYRARSALLSGLIGSAEAIGTGVSDAVKFGGGDTFGGTIRSDSVRFAAMNLMANHFDFGGVFSEVQTPIRKAGQRVGDITTAIARAGGPVPHELRSRLRDIFLAQEKRVEAESRQVQALFSDKETTAQAMQDTKLGTAIDKLGTAIDKLNTWLTAAGKFWGIQ